MRRPRVRPPARAPAHVPVWEIGVRTEENHDGGDEHLDAPVHHLPGTRMDLLIADFTSRGADTHEHPYVTDLTRMAEIARECCAHCAAELNGEDGS